MCNSILATSLTIFISSPPPTHPVPTPNLRVKACHSYWDLYAVLRSHPSPTEPVVHTASRVPEEVLRLLDPHVRSPTHESSVIHLCSVCSMYNSVVLSVLQLHPRHTSIRAPISTQLDCATPTPVHITRIVPNARIHAVSDQRPVVFLFAFLIFSTPAICFIFVLDVAQGWQMAHRAKRDGGTSNCTVGICRLLLFTLSRMQTQRGCSRFYAICSPTAQFILFDSATCTPSPTSRGVCTYCCRLFRRFMLTVLCDPDDSYRFKGTWV